MFAFGGGFWAGLIDDDQLDFLPTIGRYRLQAGGEVVHADPADLSWTEFNAFLTFEILNDLFLAEAYAPDAIGIFFGPAYSEMDCDDLKTTGNNIGLIFGLDVYLARNVSLSASYETYGSDDDAVNISVNCRF